MVNNLYYGDSFQRLSKPSPVIELQWCLYLVLNQFLFLFDVTSYLCNSKLESHIRDKKTSNHLQLSVVNIVSISS